MIERELTVDEVLEGAANRARHTAETFRAVAARCAPEAEALEQAARLCDYEAEFFTLLKGRTS